MKKALVAGALGVSGRALVNHLVSLGDWEVIGLSRRKPEFETPARYVAIDLLNRPAVEACIGELGEVTHIFYAALQMVGNFFEEIAPNLAMLQNTVEAVERSSRGLRKVVLLEGAKYYGAHLGPYKTNFYYDQEDYLVARCSGKSWSWTALRPSSICGFAVGNPMNMATVLAVYASLCKEMGLPLRFPGTAASYGILMEMTDAELLAKAMVWAAESDRCNGQGFNITNGDFHRWQHLWPRLAEFFDMPYASPQRFPLALFMSDKGPLWDAMVKKYQLLPYSFRDAASWQFGEVIFNLEYDVMSDMTKARQFGFHEAIDTEEMLLRMFAQFQKMRFIPG
jgi:nucleoside-diphosphate-sugar epimerase